MGSPMRLSAVAFFMILTTVFLSGCENDKMAEVIDKSGKFYGHNGVMATASKAATK